MKPYYLLMLFIVCLCRLDCQAMENTHDPRDSSSAKPSRSVVKSIQELATFSSIFNLHYESSNPYSKYINTLRKRASEKLLLSLTDHKDPKIRYYSFWILAERKSEHAFPILLTHLRDSRSVAHGRCAIAICGVNQYFYSVVKPNDNGIIVFELDSNQQRVLDSTLLFDSSYENWIREIVIDDIKNPKPEYYEAISKFVRSNNLEGGRALIQYGKPEDKQLLIQYLKDSIDKRNALNIIEENPEELYYPYLLKAAENGVALYNDDDLYNALASYPRQQTVDIFHQFIKKSYEPSAYYGMRSIIHHAIKQHPNEIYAPLLDILNIK